MFLRVQLSKSFGSEPVLQEIQFELEAGQTLSILGRSGCGKTTLLKILAGLLQADHGQILLQNQEISQLSPSKRGILYLNQQPLLLPHKNLFDNMALGLRLQKCPNAELQLRVQEMAVSLELEAHLNKRPDQLSGGQLQRAAFGRALLVQPKLLLLDEPFASLDAEIRGNMQDLFTRITHQRQLSALFVTHDLKEAILMGDQIASLKQGKLTRYASKADFVADPESGAAREIQFWKKW